MRPFDAKIRVDYRDTENLVLDCRNGDVELDGSLWRNTAPAARVLKTGSHNGANGSADLYDSPGQWVEDRLVGRYVFNLTDGSLGLITSNTSNKVVAALFNGTNDDWDAGDLYRIVTPRFGNPYQTVGAKQPTITEALGIREVAFAGAETLNIPLDDSFRAASPLTNAWGMSFDFKPGVSGVGTEMVIGFPSINIFHSTVASEKGFSTFPFSKTYAGAMDEATWTFRHIDTNNAELYRNGTGLGSGTSIYTPVVAGDPAGYIGSADGASSFANCSLYGLQMWYRAILENEVDFINKTSSVRADRSTRNWADMSLRNWTDATGSADEPARINSTPYAAQKFTVANINAGNLIQISASVLGDLLSDASVGSTFTLEAVEYPSASPGISNPHAGWSALFEVALYDVGHYTFALSKADGGRVFLHLDAEDVP